MFLNGIHVNMKFTMEVEQEECVPFLAVYIYRKGDGSLMD